MGECQGGLRLAAPARFRQAYENGAAALYLWPILPSIVPRLMSLSDTSRAFRPALLRAEGM